ETDDRNRGPTEIELLEERLAVLGRASKGGSDGSKRHFELLAGFLKGHDDRGGAASEPPKPESPMPGSGTGRGAIFQQALAETIPTGGGVITGNVPAGIRPTRLEFKAIENDAGEERHTIRAHYEDGSFADYSGFTNAELYAALEFVQPTEQLKKKFGSVVGNS